MESKVTASPAMAIAAHPGVPGAHPQPPCTVVLVTRPAASRDQVWLTVAMGVCNADR
jgi:hypothetical protein